MDEENELSLGNDDSMIDLDQLKGERVDPHLRICQVDKILLRSDRLTMTQRRSLVSRRNTAKLRQRMKNQRDYARLMCIELDAIENAVSACKNLYFYSRLTDLLFLISFEVKT